MAGKTKRATIIIAAALAVLAAALCLRAFRAHAFDPDAVSVPILMYHSVCPDESLAGKYIVTDSTFREDMEYLKTKGYTAVFVSDLIDYVYDGTPLPAKPVIVTLDDGYLNNLEYVLPILRETGMKAEISVVGAYSGNSGAEREKNIAYSHLDWDEIKTLSDSGYAEIGNHTWDMHGESAGGRRGCKKLPGESAEEYGAALAGDLEKLQTASGGEDRQNAGGLHLPLRQNQLPGGGSTEKAGLQGRADLPPGREPPRPRPGAALRPAPLQPAIRRGHRNVYGPVRHKIAIFDQNIQLRA
jgi:peptidoglycan/xylan/chitin deacetylase (PgdA/CDA1 family)